MSGELQAKSWSPTHTATPLRLVGGGVQADGLTLISTAGLGTPGNGHAQLRGMVRPQGRHWFILTLPRPLGEGSLDLRIGQHRVVECIRVEERKVSTYANREGVLIPGGPKKILILIDFTDTSNLATVRAMGLSQGSESTLATVNIPVDSADLGLILDLHLWAGLRDTEGQSVSINITDKSLSPVQIPIGYEPLVMVSATVDSAIEKPALLRADRDGVYDDYVFRKGSQFLWLTTGLSALQPVDSYPTSKDDAAITGARNFQGPLILQGATFKALDNGLSIARHTAAAPAGKFTLLNINELGVVRDSHVVGPIGGKSISDTVAVGEGFLNSPQIKTSALVTIASGDRATVDRSSLFGVNLLPQATAISRATVIGTDIGKAMGTIADSVALGNALLSGAQELSESVVIGSMAHNAQQKISKTVTIGHGAARTAQVDRGVIIGHQAGYSRDAVDAVAIGADAGTILFDYSIALGSGAQAPNKGAMQLGRFDTRVVSHRGLNVRADQRDVSIGRESRLGLEFIRKLAVQEVVWNHRDASVSVLPTPPRPLAAAPQQPTLAPDQSGYQDALVAYQEADRLWRIDRDRYSEEAARYAQAIEKCMSQRLLRQAATPITGGRYELTVLAESIERAAREVGVEQAIVTDFGPNSGQQVKTRDDGQLLAAAIRGLQELDSYVHSDEFVNRVAAQQLKIIYGNKA